MEKLIHHLNEEILGEIQYKVNEENNAMILYYNLKSNCKKQRRLKIMNVVKNNQWYTINSIFSFSNIRYVKSIEIHEDEYEIVIENIIFICNLFKEIKKWFAAIYEFHNKYFAHNVKTINDLDFSYNNDEISYRFSVNPGGLIVRVRLNNFSKDTFEVLRSIAEKCNSLRGTCIVDNIDENRKNIIEEYTLPNIIKK